LFCLIGRKRPVMHVIFHIFVVLAGAVHYFAIYRFVI
jgi:predicted membrane channel-forming protein YqfA (hemolysin III family)